jgi:hypothetical protein
MSIIRDLLSNFRIFEEIGEAPYALEEIWDESASSRKYRGDWSSTHRLRKREDWTV